MALIDPPWSRKSDWTAIPDVLAAAVRASTRATFLLWYPVKSLTRPNAMLARLEAAGVGGTIAELITTPLEHTRNRLNGSGVLLVRPPDGVVEALAAAAPIIGRALRDGRRDLVATAARVARARQRRPAASLRRFSSWPSRVMRYVDRNARAIR